MAESSSSTNYTPYLTPFVERWEETGAPPAAPAPAADRFASFFKDDEDDDTAAEEGRKRSLDETDYAAPPPQM